MISAQKWPHERRAKWLGANNSHGASGLEFLMFFGRKLPPVILCDLFGMVKWPFQRLSDLQLGDKKVALNHLADFFRRICVKDSKVKENLGGFFSL